MLTKKQNPKANYFGRLLVLPLAVLVFAAFSLKVKNSAGTYHGKKITVVIDAGHGGTDNGAVSSGGVFEKDITLAIAKKVKALNTNDDISIVLTRDGDVYMDPKQKAAFAESKNAAMLISLHVDATPKPTQLSGISFWVARNEFANSAESKVLASTLINEFTGSFGLTVESKILQREKGIWILQANNIPSVLIQTGYITNSSDIAYLQTNAARETIARNLLAGIEKYLTKTPNPTALVDTVPSKSPTIQQWEEATPKEKGRLDGIDTKKALIIFNGEILGTGKAAEQKMNSLITGSISVKWLGKKVAVAKYGKAAEFGACETVEIKEEPSSSTTIRSDSKIIMKGVNESLIVVDGVIKEKDYNINQIDPANIESVDVLKGNSATTLYGEKGKNGVISIKTKKPMLMPEVVAMAKSKTSNKAMAAPTELSKESKVTNLQLETSPAGSNIVFTKAETEPEFPGGIPAWRKYLEKNVNPLIPVDEGWKPGVYKVMVSFIVRSDGSVSDISTDNFKGSKTALHCIQLIKNTPQWQAAIQNGRKVNAYKKQPITFVIEEDIPVILR